MKHMMPWIIMSGITATAYAAPIVDVNVPTPAGRLDVQGPNIPSQGYYKEDRFFYTQQQPYAQPAPQGYYYTQEQYYSQPRTNGVIQSGTTKSTNVYDRYITEQDREINQKIREKLIAILPGRNYDMLMISTSNGVVVIEGMVDSQDDQARLSNEIKKIDGVRSVENRTKVQQ